MLNPPRNPRAFALTTMGLVLLATLGGRAQSALPLQQQPPAPAQPLPYSHRQHLVLDVDCRDCHVNPDAGELMTYPVTETCMSCHARMPATTGMLQKLATLAESGQPIPWARVYRLESYVYWSHATHLGANVACETCHGPVADRDVIRIETDILTMKGCVACHDKRQTFTDCDDCHEPRQ